MHIFERFLNVLKALHSFCTVRIYFWRGLGVLPTLKLTLSAFYPEKLTRLRLYGYPAPVFLRPNTSDIRVLEDVFIWKAFHIKQIQELQQPKFIVDAGANIGFSSIVLAKSCPEATIIAVEPESSNYELLVQNTAPYKNIVPMRGGIWSKHTMLNLVSQDVQKWSFQFLETSGSQSQSVEALTIPDILALYQTDHIDVLKIDIEGAEKELFSFGTEAWLDKVKMIVIEFHDLKVPGSSATFYRAILHYDFKHFISREKTVIVFDTTL